MKYISSIFAVCVYLISTDFASALVNVVNFKIISRFNGDKFSPNSGYRKDLVDGELIDLSDEQSLKVAEIIADRLLELERISGDPKSQKTGIDIPTKLELRNIIFNLNRYCFKIQGYKNKEGKKFAYVIGFPLVNSSGEVKFKSIPEKIPGFDDGGSQYWQGYVDMESWTIDFVFNKGF